MGLPLEINKLKLNLKRMSQFQIDINYSFTKISQHMNIHHVGLILKLILLKS